MRARFCACGKPARSVRRSSWQWTTRSWMHITIRQKGLQTLSTIFGGDMSERVNGRAGERASRLGRWAMAFALLALTGCGYNTIQTLDEQTNQQKANIETELMRRNDLIPNLVATVDAAAAH